MTNAIRVSLLLIGLFTSIIATAEWGAQSVNKGEWYRTNYQLVTGKVAYRDTPTDGYTEGYYPTKTLDIGGYHVRQIFDYNSMFTAGYIFKQVSERLLRQGFTPIYTCQSLECGDVEGWRLLSSRLLDGESQSQAYIVAHNPLGGESGTYIAIHLANLDNRPRATIDVVFSDPSLRQTLDLEDIQVIPVYSQSNVLAGSQIYFGHNSAEIPEQMESALVSLADTLKDQTDSNLIIVGHSDSTGTYEHNVGLSHNRAEAVKRKLLGYGVDASDIKVVGVGSAMADPNSDSQFNRRVEVITKSP
ncbi:OmpA family protein [Gilvimarinus chinensis]|uniref:OmpA family protein n=1 Tax=Gilvimarinus chinensis TaxID=396005 RepID=UPI00036FF6A7|nr:OmpA family protein [Gilvimarinus chinensis]